MGEKRCGRYGQSYLKLRLIKVTEAFIMDSHLYPKVKSFLMKVKEEMKKLA